MSTEILVLHPALYLGTPNFTWEISNPKSEKFKSVEVAPKNFLVTRLNAQ